MKVEQAIEMHVGRNRNQQGTNFAWPNCDVHTKEVVTDWKFVLDGGHD